MKKEIGKGNEKGEMKKEKDHAVVLVHPLFSPFPFLL
jgi:hypothetical protein